MKGSMSHASSLHMIQKQTAAEPFKVVEIGID